MSYVEQICQRTGVLGQNMAKNPAFFQKFNGKKVFETIFNWYRTFLEKFDQLHIKLLFNRVHFS